MAKRGMNQILTFKAVGTANFTKLKTSFGTLTKELKKYKDMTDKGKNTTKQFTKVMNSLKATAKDAALLGLNKINSAVKTMAKSIGVTLIGAITAATVAFRSLVNEGIELAKVQYEVESKVKSTFGQAGLDQLKTTASDIQKVGIIGDEKILTAANALGTYGLSQSAVNSLLYGLTDYAAHDAGYDASETDLEGYGKTIGAAIAKGTTRSLKSMGIYVDDAAFSAASIEQRAAMVSAAMSNSSWAGSNEAMAKTDQGMINNATNQIGDVKEEIGKLGLTWQAMFYQAIVPYLPILQEIGQQIMAIGLDALQEFLNYVNAHKEEILAGLRQALAWLKTLPEKIPVLMDKLSWIAKHAEAILKGFAIFAVITYLIEKLVFVVIAVKIVIGWVKVLAPFLLTCAKEVIAFVQLIPEMLATLPEAVGLAAAAGIGGIIATGISAVVLAIGKVVEWLNNKFNFNQNASDSFNATIGKFLVDHGIGSFDDRGVLQLGSNALGTPYGRGLTTINERGGEIMRLPSGTTIIPADKSAAMMGGNNISINLNVQGNMIGNKQYAEELCEYMVRQTELALAAT